MLKQYNQIKNTGLAQRVKGGVSLLRRSGVSLNCSGGVSLTGISRIDQLLINLERQKAGGPAYVDSFYGIFVIDKDAWTKAYKRNKQLLEKSVLKLKDAGGYLILVDGLNRDATNNMTILKEKVTDSTSETKAQDLDTQGGD